MIGVWLAVAAAVVSVGVLAAPALGVRVAASGAAVGCTVPNVEGIHVGKAFKKVEKAGCGVPVDQPLWTGDDKSYPGCMKKRNAGEVLAEQPFPGKRLKHGRLVLTTCPKIVRGKPAVHVVYAVPQGVSWNSGDTAGIAEAISSLQGWYLGQVGKTFSIAAGAPLKCRLPYAASEYAVDTWNKVLTDIQPCANATFSSKHADWIVYAAVDHKCNAAGPIGEGEPGLTILGQTDLNGLIGAPVTECGQSFDYPVTRWIGGLGHELGHTFGLPHPPGCDQGLPSCDTNALMWLGYINYPNTYLRQDEITPLRKSPYFWKTTADGR